MNVNFLSVKDAMSEYNKSESTIRRLIKSASKSNKDNVYVHRNESGWWFIDRALLNRTYSPISTSHNTVQNEWLAEQYEKMVEMNQRLIDQNTKLVEMVSDQNNKLEVLSDSLTKHRLVIAKYKKVLRNG
jgi:uncharacterized coiled-coil protein SlyX